MPTLRYHKDGFAVNDHTSPTIAMNNEPIRISIALSPCAKATSALMEDKATSNHTTLNRPYPPQQEGQPQAPFSDASTNQEIGAPLLATTACAFLLPANEANLKRTKKIANPRTLKGGTKVAVSSRARKLPSKNRAPPTKKSMMMMGNGTAHTTAFSSEHTESISEVIKAQSTSTPSTLQLKRAKASSPRARKLPTKLTRGGAGLNSCAARTTEVAKSSLGGSGNNDYLIPPKQAPISADGGVGTATLVVSKRPAKKTATKIEGLVSLDSLENNEHILKKRKKVKTTKGEVESSSVSQKEQSKLFSNQTKRDYSQIIQAVKDITAVIADEIRHCPFLFQLTNRPKIIISSEMEGGVNKKIYVAPDNGGSGSASQGSPYPNPCDVNSIVEAVRRFVVEVYCPFLLSARQSVKISSLLNVDRIRLSTLLAIREMLIMNGATLFTSPTLKSLSERLYLSHVFANAIVRNTAKRLHSNAGEGSTFLADFIQATHNYDARAEDFQFALTRADARSVYVHQGQGGKQVGPEESIVAKIGYNYARERHPLLRYGGRLHVKESGDVAMGVSGRPLACAAPTACAAFYIESTIGRTAEQGGDDDKETLESFKRLLKNNSKTGSLKTSSDDVITTQHRD